MKHYGDITQMSGFAIPTVDIITGGSPCQDLSVAGKREGMSKSCPACGYKVVGNADENICPICGAELEYTRSGLFMEQIRLVKETRENDRRNGRTGELVRPRYMVWENVAGAFSSNNGKDFQAVLTEIVRVVEPKAPDVPLPDKGGWPSAGSFYGVGADGCTFSVAWRMHDAQYHGVPQRRKRLCVLADFGGLTAPWILFDPQFERASESGEPIETLRDIGAEPRPEVQSERESLSGNTEPSGTEREEATGAVGGGTEGASGAISFQERAGKPGGGKGILIQNERTGALSTLNNQSVLQLGCDIYNQDITGEVAASLTAACGGTNTSGAKVLCLNAEQEHKSVMCSSDGEIAGTLDANYYKGCGLRRSRERTVVYSTPATGDHQNRATDYSAIVSSYQDVTGTLSPGAHAGSYNGQDAYNDMLIVTYGLDRASYNQGKNAKFGFSIEKELIGAQVAKGPGAVCTAVDCRNGTEDENVNASLQASASHNTNSNNVCRCGSVVRRLTPLECERLQGFPDIWSKYGINEKGKVYELPDSARYKLQGNSIARPFWTWLLRRIAAQYERTATLGSLFDGQGGFPLCAVEAGIIPIWASEIEKHAIAVTKYRFPEASND